jgi:hypothetical protein
VSEPLSEPVEPEGEGTQPPVDPDAAMAQRNLQFGWALAALFVILFAGTFGVAFVYLWLS